jgi:hypothetical protein
MFSVIVVSVLQAANASEPFACLLKNILGSAKRKIFETFVTAASHLLPSARQV